MTMTSSALGRATLTQREGCVLTAYQDSVGVWTVGVGHTGRATPPKVVPGMTITKAEADALLAADLLPFEAAVNRAITRAMAQNQFDAMVSLAFNIGASGFLGSTVVHRFNAGDLSGAADAFLMWTKPPELKSRRIAERSQFLTPDSKVDHGATVATRTTAPAAAAAKPSWLDRAWMALTFRNAR